MLVTVFNLYYVYELHWFYYRATQLC